MIQAAVKKKNSYFKTLSNLVKYQQDFPSCHPPFSLQF